MTAPAPSSSSSGSTASTSTRTMSSTATHPLSPKGKSRSLSHLKKDAKQADELSDSNKSAPITTTATSKSGNSNNKKRMASLLKYPKKLLTLSNGKYPQSKIVKESIEMLEDELQVMTQHAPFVDSVTADTSVCLLDRKEVVVGELLGQGQFAQVYEVKDLKLREDRSETLSQPERTKRESFVQDFHSCPTSCTKPCHSFAVKHLKKDLLVNPSRLMKKRRNRNSSKEISAGDSDLPMDQQFQLAAADLVVEALYLSRLQHAHIIKVRGAALGGTAAFATGRYDSYFLILDKLTETLDERIRHWRRTTGQPQETQLCLKTTYAYQMAQALEYLHQHRIIFRDLKPSNIGFKQEDDTLQIFDFGLCRELPPPQGKDPNEVYFMTAAGTHRYMAVEVHRGEQYNLKADVFSFAMVCYELLAQEAPFLNFSEEDHQKLVCERQHRPKHFFGCVVPLSIQKLLDDAWAHEPNDRLTMSQVVTRLQDILVHTFHQEIDSVTPTKEKHHKECCPSVIAPPEEKQANDNSIEVS